MKILLAFATLALAASFAFAQAPKLGAVAKPKPTAAAPLPALDAASAAALAPLATQRTALLTQIAALNVQLGTVAASWRIAEGKALAAAGLDPGQYAVDRTGTKFTRQPRLP